MVAASGVMGGTFTLASYEEKDFEGAYALPYGETTEITVSENNHGQSVRESNLPFPEIYDMTAESVGESQLEVDIHKRGREEPEWSSREVDTGQRYGFPGEDWDVSFLRDEENERAWAILESPDTS